MKSVVSAGVVLVGAVLVVLFCAGLVEGHGYMVEPKARSGKQAFLVNKAPCGGDAYNTPGEVVATYEAGKTYPMTWLPLANHGRNIPVSYRLCTTQPATEECFAKNVLATVPNPGGNGNPVTGQVTIPADAECEKCTISWVWDVPGQTYTNCADVKIVKAGGANTGSLLETNGTSSSSGMSKGGAVVLTIFLTAGILIALMIAIVVFMIKSGRMSWNNGHNDANTDYQRMSDVLA